MVELREFGRFYSRKRETRNDRKTKSGEKVDVPDKKRALFPGSKNNESDCSK
jgi:nucleoid DNA-binding protein